MKYFAMNEFRLYERSTGFQKGRKGESINLVKKRGIQSFGLPKVRKIPIL
ncbi:hypothetical protein D083_0762 [Dickeya solani RNS 08.23.3.1.A]|nr:hypothetical protein D083_0762 [Dickeya solani RNS 08.23.3.1.A]